MNVGGFAWGGERGEEEKREGARRVGEVEGERGERSGGGEGDFAERMED